MQIIRAQASDAPALSTIAQAAKASWGYAPHWLEQWRDELTLTPLFVAENETFFAREHGEIVGFHALRVTPRGLRLEHLWVLPAAMGTGIGRALFTHAAERAASLGADRLAIEADPNAEPFYLHLGAVRTGTVVSEIEGCRRELPILEFSLTKSALRAETASDGNSPGLRRPHS
ncbi:MAG: GNAT family N-acetyltransferase [Chthoniobacterales bacterium]|nr:GNAT family N-acetyltransferase [Chthoniobacterales bacterium]